MVRVALILWIAACLSTAVFAGTIVDCIGVDGDAWNDVDTWSTATIPGQTSQRTDTVSIGNGASIVLDSDQTGGAGNIDKVHVYMNPGASKPSTLTVNAGAKLDLSAGYVVGTTTCNSALYIGSNFGPIVPAGTGNYVQNGGDVAVNTVSVGDLASGVSGMAGPLCRMTINGGTFTSGRIAGSKQLYDSFGMNGRAELVINGGTTTLGAGAQTASSNHIIFAGYGDSSVASSARVTVNDGMLNLGTSGAAGMVFLGGYDTSSLGGTATLEITGGTVNVPRGLWVGQCSGQGAIVVSGTGQLIVGAHANDPSAAAEYFGFGAGNTAKAQYLQTGGTVISKFLGRIGRGVQVAVGTQSGGYSRWEMSDKNWGIASGGLEVGSGAGKAMFTLSGGTMECEGMSLSRNNGGSTTFIFTGGTLITHDSWSATAAAPDVMVWSPALFTTLTNSSTVDFVWNGGTLMVSGTIQLGYKAGKILTNGGGTLSPYSADSNSTVTSKVGTAHIFGGYVMSATASLVVDVNGSLTAGTSYDQVIISADTAGGKNPGSLTLGGHLQVNLGYVPPRVNELHQIISMEDPTQSVVGSFIGMPDDAEKPLTVRDNFQVWAKVDYNGGGETGNNNDVILALRALRLGDADGNDMVDQRDYAVWFNNNGCSPRIWSQGDWNLDGMVDQRDYALWYNNNGFVRGSSEVPEPTTMLLLILGFAGGWRSRH